MQLIDTYVQMLRISYKSCKWLASQGQIYDKIPNFDGFGGFNPTLLHW